MNRESIKIIVTGIIAVILLSIGIYAFIYRNELSGKIQDISKKPDQTEKVDRLILPPPAIPDAGKDSIEKIDMSSPILKKDPVDRKNIPSMDAMRMDNPMDKDFKSFSDDTMLPEKKSMSSVEMEPASGKKSKIAPMQKKKAMHSGSKKMHTVKRHRNLHRNHNALHHGKKNLNLEKRVSRLERKMHLNGKRNKNSSLEKRIAKLEQASKKRHRRR